MRVCLHEAIWDWLMNLASSDSVESNCIGPASSSRLRLCLALLYIARRNASIAQRLSSGEYTRLPPASDAGGSLPLRDCNGASPYLVAPCIARSPKAPLRKAQIAAPVEAPPLVLAHQRDRLTNLPVSSNAAGSSHRLLRIVATSICGTAARKADIAGVLFSPTSGEPYGRYSERTRRRRC